LTIGIYYLIIRPGYLTHNRGAKNRIDFDIVVYPFTTLVIPKTDWWQRIEGNIPMVVTARIAVTTPRLIVRILNSVFLKTFKNS